MVADSPILGTTTSDPTWISAGPISTGTFASLDDVLAARLGRQIDRCDGAAVSEGPNAGQVAYWNEAVGPTWAELQEPLDRQLGPLGRAAMAALKPRPGERILDIGCGSGQTSVELAGAVAPDGAVLGVDISRPLLDTARARSPGANDVTFLEADAQTAAFEPGAFDAAFSRFGVMFFADPPAAFANIRRALKPGGRLAFICWRGMVDNPIMTLPMMAAGKRFMCRVDTTSKATKSPHTTANHDTPCSHSGRCIIWAMSITVRSKPRTSGIC